MICFECHGEGHIASECTFANSTSGPWCGICDPLTHLVGTPQGVQRCPDCHPLRHEHLRQHRRCPGCKMLVHEWDAAPCGSHSSPVAKDRRPTKEHIREIVSSNS